MPTVAQAGVPGYEVTSWNGVFAPVGTPPEIIDLLNKTIREMVAMPEVKQRYGDLGIEAEASTPAELQARLERDIKKWAAVIERAGIPKQCKPRSAVRRTRTGRACPREAGSPRASSIVSAG